MTRVFMKGADEFASEPTGGARTEAVISYSENDPPRLYLSDTGTGTAVK